MSEQKRFARWGTKPPPGHRGSGRQRASTRAFGAVGHGEQHAPVEPSASHAGRELAWLRARQVRPTLQQLVGSSAKMATVFRAVGRVAERWSNAPVLVRGEMGTGKTSFARAIHSSGRRREGPLIELDCADEQAVKPWLTDEGRDVLTLADEGTLLLDRIDFLPIAAQRRLLGWLAPRAVRDGWPDVQLITTAQRDLDFMAQQGLFSRDLVRHLSPIVVPPLRERDEDAVELAQHFLQQLARRYRQDAKPLSDGARWAIRHYRWPANVRELRVAMERVVLIEDADVVEPEMLCLRDERIHARLGRAKRRHRQSSAVSGKVISLGSKRGPDSIDTTYCMIRGQVRASSDNLTDASPRPSSRVDLP